MHIDFMLDNFNKNSDNIAVIWKGGEYTYKWLFDKVLEYQSLLNDFNIKAGQTVAIRSDFKPISIALLIALIENGNIIIPISLAVKNYEEFYEISEAENIIDISDDSFNHKISKKTISHELLLKLRKIKHPGLILFSSGSTGKSKAAVHDFIPLLNKFKVKRHTLTTLTFLLFDHIGGVNTLLYILSNAGTIISTEDRSPANICKLIEKYKIELLPTSPTFIFMILMTRAYEQFDLSSLKLVTYGTEAMPESILKKFHSLFPNIKLKQTYGLSELGILRSKSRSDSSLWVKVGGEDFQIKVVEDILFIKAKSAMLGYLNAPSPFDEEGWFNTQDKVIVDGEWLKILGRVTDIINVGGQKVYPTEVESVLLGIDNISDVTIYRKDNPLLGQIVAAKISLNTEEPIASLKKRVREYCKDKLDNFKIPVYFEITETSQVSARFKKIR